MLIRDLSKCGTGFIHLLLSKNLIYVIKRDAAKVNLYTDRLARIHVTASGDWGTDWWSSPAYAAAPRVSEVAQGAIWGHRARAPGPYCTRNQCGCMSHKISIGAPKVRDSNFEVAKCQL